MQKEFDTGQHQFETNIYVERFGKDCLYPFSNEHISAYVGLCVGMLKFKGCGECSEMRLL